MAGLRLGVSRAPDDASAGVEGPDDLPAQSGRAGRAGRRVAAPLCAERLDEQQPASGLGIQPGVLAYDRLAATAVPDLNQDAVLVRSQPEPPAAADRRARLTRALRWW
jgi:hypothetical protein